MHAAAGYFGRENWGKNGKALQEWTGIQGYTIDEQPIVGEAPGQKDCGYVLAFMAMVRTLVLENWIC